MKNRFKLSCDQKKKDKRTFLIGEVCAFLFLIPIFVFCAWSSMTTIADNAEMVASTNVSAPDYLMSEYQWNNQNK